MATKKKDPAGRAGAPAAMQAAASSQQSAANGMPKPTTDPVAAPTAVNKKKQKRREKEAEKAKKAAEQHSAVGFALTNVPVGNGHRLREPRLPSSTYDDPNFAADAYGRDDADDVYSDEDENGYDSEAEYQSQNGVAQYGSRPSKSKDKRPSAPVPQTNRHLMHGPPRPSRAYMPTISTEALRTVQRKTLNASSIWDTNSAKERAAIKEFWIGLSEMQRKDLVNIEKGHVLQKMKEQQKHSCSCTVCGRKRTAIEEELEILLQDPRIWADPTLEPPPNRLLPSDRDYPSSSQPVRSAHGRIQELRSDGEEEEEEDEEEDDDEEEEEDEDDSVLGPEGEDEEGRYSEDGYSDDLSYTNDVSDVAGSGAASQFFKFGNSLTVKDGVLSVADDLLKNDGQKFIDMMEHLAERRMQREEDARYAHSHYIPQPGLPPPPPHAHSHATQPPAHAYEDPEDEEEEEDEGEYDSQEEYAEDEESDDIDHLDENERMEEGRRMFQIFAARMFEQRVVQAYKEKVATDRQNALIAAEEEQGGEGQSEAKKAKAAEKKRRQREKAKEIKAQKDAIKEEERKRKEAALREAEEKKKEEQRQKQEEARKRKDAEREVLAERKRRKEAETQKRLDAERERQHEQERKQREQKADEKRKRDEAERKKREDKELREKEMRDRRAQEERDKRSRENHAPISVLSRNDAVDRGADLSKRSTLPAAVALPPSLQQPKQTTATNSPQPKIATPALPKPPTPVRPQEVLSRQVPTPQTPEHPPQSRKPLSPRPTTSIPVQPPGLPSSRASSHHPSFSQAPLQPSLRPIQPPPGMMPPIGMANPGMMTGGYAVTGGLDPRQNMRQPMARQSGPAALGSYPPAGQGLQNRPFTQQNPPPGMPPMQARPNAADLGGFGNHQLPMASPMSNPAVFATPHMAMAGHARQPSAHLESPPADNQQAPPAPIGSKIKSSAPAPIRRPASINAGQRRGGQVGNTDVDDLSLHLGSSALLADDDGPDVLPPARGHDNRQSSGALGMNAGFLGSPFDQGAPLGSGGGLRGRPLDGWTNPTYGATSQRSWNQPSGWGGPASGFPHQRQQQLEKARFHATLAYRVLCTRSMGYDGYFDQSEIIRSAVDSSNSVQGNRQPTSSEDVQRGFAMPGDGANGGGTFHTRVVDGGRHFVKWVADIEPGQAQGSVSLGPGHVGSPVSESRLAALAGPGRF